MSPPNPLPDALVELIAERFRAIGEPTRIRILDALRQAPATPQELTDMLGTSQQNVSKHLGVLARAGILSREREGNRVRYAIADHSVLEMCDSVCGAVARQLDELRALIGEEVSR